MNKDTSLTHVWVFRWPIKQRVINTQTGHPRRFLFASRTAKPTRRESWEVVDVVPGGVWLRRNSMDPRCRMFSLRSRVCMDFPDLILSRSAFRQLRLERYRRWKIGSAIEFGSGQRETSDKQTSP